MKKDVKLRGNDHHEEERKKTYMKPELTNLGQIAVHTNSIPIEGT